MNNECWLNFVCLMRMDNNWMNIVCRYTKSQSLPHLLPSPSYSDILDISTKHFAQQITAMDNVSQPKAQKAKYIDVCRSCSSE